MNKYAIIALKAAALVDTGIDPKSAWEISSCEVFAKGSASQKKGCPKNAFLGLYGINTTTKNAVYAVKARERLSQNNTNITPNQLWKIVMAGEQKAHNHQMDVVLALCTRE